MSARKITTHNSMTILGDANDLKEMFRPMTSSEWASFDAMLTEEQQEEIGVSSDRSLPICITRLCQAYIDAKEEVERTKRQSPVCPDCKRPSLVSQSGRLYCLGCGWISDLSKQ